MRATETWVYAGRRVGKGNKQAYAWIDPTGKELWYGQGFQGTVIGGRYDVQVDRASANTSVFGKPSYVGRTFIEDQRLVEWQAKHEAANALLAAASRERSDAKRNALDGALAPLMDVARSLRTQSEKDAFIAHVIRKLNAAW